MGLLAKIQNKITKRTPKEPSITRDEIHKFIEDIHSTSTNRDPFANQHGFLGALMGQQSEILGSLLGGMTQEQQYQRYLSMAQQQSPAISQLQQQMAMDSMPALGVCQPARPGRKHVDCHIVEPKGLPAPAAPERSL